MAYVLLRGREGGIVTEFNVGDRVRNIDLYLAEIDKVPLGALGTVLPKVAPNGFIRVAFDLYPFTDPERGWPVLASEIEKVED